jgi:hypothetical protein
MFNEYNTKITYLVDNKLDIKRTAKSYAKFYVARCARITAYKLKRIYNAEIHHRLNSTAQ